MTKARWFWGAVILAVCFHAAGFAEMAAVDLRELLKQSDAVVLGEVLKPQSAGNAAVTFRVQRYIYARTHDPYTEDGKMVSLILVLSLPAPDQEPGSIPLVPGKQYLLFLTQTASPEKSGNENAYALTSPQHGVFEDGRKYSVYDEKDPQYPAAVQVSFQQIVDRISPGIEKNE